MDASTTELLVRHSNVYRETYVSLDEMVYNLRSGWWACFRTPTSIVRGLPRNWANCPSEMDAMCLEDRQMVKYILLLKILERFPVHHQSQEANNGIKEIQWKDTGILWQDNIKIQIRYLSPYAPGT